MKPIPFPKPTRQQLEAAVSKTVPDLVRPGLDVLFCGINPGLYSGATGHHFARPGNRFWPALFAGGFTPRLISAFEEKWLLKYGCGITNVVRRTTATAAELRPEEFIAGGKSLVRKVKHYRPKFMAVLGVMAYRGAFNRPDAKVGPQTETIGDTRLWVLPNPSGLNAHYTPTGLAKLFAELKSATK